MTNRTEPASLIHAYTAEDAERDGLLIRYNPATALEAGYAIPLLLTVAAHRNAVEWTRGGGWQSEDARFWDVLSVIRAAAKASLASGRAYQTKVYRVPNRTRSGALSKSTTATPQALVVRAEGFNLLGEPCIIVSLPGED